MPNYGASGTPVGLFPSNIYKLFNAESPTAPQASVSVANSRTPTGDYSPITFDIEFSAAPTDSLNIQGAMTDTNAAYQTLFTSTNKQQDTYGDVGGFAFYRVLLSSWTGGGTLTVLVRR